MFCKNCGAQMQPNQAICLNCGVKTGEGTAFCANCGQPVAPGAAVCLSCGVATTNANAQYLGGKDKLVMALICFFLGGIGIHNFVLGETKKGVVKIIAQVITCGVAGSVLALIDFIKILTDKYEVNPDAMF